MRLSQRLAAATLLLALAFAGGAPTAAQSHDPHEHHHDHHAGAHGATELVSPPGGPILEPDGGPVRIAPLDVAFTDQSGATGVLADLVDRPLLVTFFYTRCQNSRKCPLTVSRLAGLQRQLEAAGLADRVRLLAITYEPRFDTPERLARYVGNRGLVVGPGIRALRLDPERQQELIDALRVEVAYNAGWVSGHGVELSLLDAEGLLVRKYHAVYWQNPRVVEDVRHLLAAGGDGASAAGGGGGARQVPVSPDSPIQ